MMDPRSQHTEITFQLVTEERKGAQGFNEQHPSKLLVTRTGGLSTELALNDVPATATVCSLIATALAEVDPLTLVWVTGLPGKPTSISTALQSPGKERPTTTRLRGGARSQLEDKDFHITVTDTNNHAVVLSIRPLKQKLCNGRNIYNSDSKISLNYPYQAVTRLITTRKAWVSYDELVAEDWRDTLVKSAPERVYLPSLSRKDIASGKMGSMRQKQDELVWTDPQGKTHPLMQVDPGNRGVYFGKHLKQLEALLINAGTKVDFSDVDLCLDEPAVKENPTWTQPITLETLITQ